MTKKMVDEKLYYSISEVSKMTSIEAYVLRYWEKEFSLLKPRKNRGGNRQYTMSDIETVNRIRHLRRNEKLTIDGTRARLMMRRGTEVNANAISKAKIKTLVGKLRRDVEDILKYFP